MKSNNLITYVPINFRKNSLLLFVKIFSIFIGAWIINFVLSSKSSSSLQWKDWLVIGIVFIAALIISILQILLYRIYIYEVIQKEEHLTFKWQELMLLKEITLPIKDVSIELKPSGKDTPYMELKLKYNSTTILLKQTYYPGWNKQTMKNFISQINQLKNFD